MGKTGKRPTKPKGNGKPAPAKKPTPGCYVLSLTVENIRCFGPKQTLDCSDGEGRPRQWTVILGDNGTGKTTLLYAIAIHVLGGLSRSEDYGKRLLRRNDCEGKSSLRVTFGSLQETLSDPDLLVMRGSFNTEKGPGIEKWRETEPGRTGEIKSRFALFAYGSERFRFQSGTRQLDMRPGRNIDALLEDEVLLDAERWLLDLDYAAQTSEDEQPRELRRQIRELLMSVLPGITEITFVPGVGPVPRPRVEFHSSYGAIPLRQLGHGYQTMIAWVVDFVSRMVERYPDSENPLTEPAVCLVDEIDLHLHPVWQRKVIGYLSDKFKRTQFIVTAHSPLVVQAAASANANIAVLVRSTEKDTDNNHYVEIRNNPEDVHNWRLDQILTSDLFGGLSLNPPIVEELFKEKEHLLGLSRLTPKQKERLAEIDVQLAKLPVGDDAREVKEMQAIREALAHLQKRPAQ